jgi:Domain of unknown function (DUF4157)
VSDQENERPEDLSDELAKKYDPERLLKMVGKRAGKGEALDSTVRNKYERRFGVDLGHVRIYTGEFAEEFNRKRDAYAVTIGGTGMILMGGSAEKSMGSSAGQALLAHELTHVAQASRGAGGGLARKASFDGGMPFTEEHEAEAEGVEHSEAEGGSVHGDTKASANAASNKLASKEALEKALEQVRERVMDMAADAARTQYARNGLQRRP